ncbi:capsular polysaccharide synthesis protein [Weissella cibaria]|uniref:capsular polysaccharide synthesis protein n=1 Tax=Weissella cibaria TaxID=137591 RepID=UPI00215B6709|nr:capsular polysaccharide synthesis protein [Weissella cibaria]MCR8702364.1 capsular polysaccharide synthesis protein [Weissella cibaria]
MQIYFFKKTITICNQIVKLNKVLSIPYYSRVMEIYQNWIVENVMKLVSVDPAEYIDETFQLNDSNKALTWVMWWQGEENAPKIVKSNVKRMKSVFGEANVVVIDQNNYSQFTDINPAIIDKFKRGKITFAALSDVIRFNLLSRHGGLWLDATLCVSDEFKNIKIGDFFSLSFNKDLPDYISRGDWSGWLVGGNHNIFKYMNDCLHDYWLRYDTIVNYFLPDEFVRAYVNAHPTFKRKLKDRSLDWEPFAFSDNYKKIEHTDLLHRWNSELEFSVQKVSYRLHDNGDHNLLNSICSEK